MKLEKLKDIKKGHCEPQDVGLCVSHEVDRETPMNLGEVRKEKGNQKVYCEPQDVGFCVSPEVGGGKPTELGEVMSKKVDAMGPLEVGKGNTQKWLKVCHGKRVKAYLLKIYKMKNFRKTGRKHNIKTGLSKKVQETTNVCWIIFDDWDPTERLKSSTWRESETLRLLIK